MICEDHQRCQLPVPNSPPGKRILIKHVTLKKCFSIFPIWWQFKYITKFFSPAILTPTGPWPSWVPLLYLLTFPPPPPIYTFVLYIYILYLYFYVQTISNKMLTNNRCPLVGWTISVYKIWVQSLWRRLHNEELNDLYSSPNIVRVIKSRIMRWAGHVVHMGEERGLYRVLVGKPEGRRSLGRPRRRWMDNIRMDLQEVGCGYMDWIGLAQDRDRWRTLVSAVMNLRVPWNAGNFLTSCKPVSCSRRTLHHGVSK